MPRKSRAGGSPLSSTLSVRICPRTRYGLFLLSRKGREKTSEVVQTLMRAAMAGRMDMLATFVLPELDELWHPLPWERLKKLKALRPGWMSSNEIVALETVMEHGDRMNSDVWKSLQIRFRLDC